MKAAAERWIRPVNEIAIIDRIFLVDHQPQSLGHGRLLLCAKHSMPSAGGSLPNDVFSELLELPTVWVPHSYRGCSQHAPNEHLPTALAREALGPASTG